MKEGRRLAKGAKAGATISRFWSLVDKSAGPRGCWLWKGPVAGKGYGYFCGVRVHRFVYELMRGPIPLGMQVDHVKARGCTSRLCCQPGHMEAVTNRENVLRGDHPNAVAHRTDTCKRGHSLENARVRPGKGRSCRVCANLRERARKAAKRASA